MANSGMRRHPLSESAVLPLGPTRRGEADNPDRCIRLRRPRTRTPDPCPCIPWCKVLARAGLCQHIRAFAHRLRSAEAEYVRMELFDCISCVDDQFRFGDERLVIERPVVGDDDDAVVTAYRSARQFHRLDVVATRPLAAVDFGH